MYKFSRKSILPNILLFLVVISSAWGVIWSISAWGISDQRYFTNQSNVEFSHALCPEDDAGTSG